MDEEIIYEIVRLKIKHFRTMKNMRQEQLAEKAGINRTTISNIENGNQKITLHMVYQIASVLKVKPYEILPDEYMVKKYKAFKSEQPNNPLFT